MHRGKLKLLATDLLPHWRRIALIVRSVVHHGIVTLMALRSLSYAYACEESHQGSYSGGDMLVNGHGPFDTQQPQGNRPQNEVTKGNNLSPNGVQLGIAQHKAGNHQQKR